MNAYLKRSNTGSKTLGLWARILLVPVLALGLSGCGTTKPPTAHAASHSDAHHAQLELNQGKKWVVHKPMMAHIRDLESSVRNFDDQPQQDHAVLAAEIQEDLGRLVTNCTMEGKAHDELHKWLMPFLALSTEYAEATDRQVQKQKLGEIKQALIVFDEHFE